MRYLLFSIATSILLVSCASDYRALRPITPDSDCISKLSPGQFKTSWYNASVDVVGKHISGLLLIKNMPDSAQRIVFTNETGVTFFDFGFSKDGSFKVFNIIKQLDKRPVVYTLRKDFELILGIPFRNRHFESWINGEEIFYGVKQKKETAYFITSKDCASLRRLEWGSTRKQKVVVQMEGLGYSAPEKIELTHKTFNMQIKLTRFEKE